MQLRYQVCTTSDQYSSSVFKSTSEFLVYPELMSTENRSYIHGVTSVHPEWLVQYAVSLCTYSAHRKDPKHCYDPCADLVFCYVIPHFGPYLWKLLYHRIPIKDITQRVAVFAYALRDGQVLPCLEICQKVPGSSTKQDFETRIIVSEAGW